MIIAVVLLVCLTVYYFGWKTSESKPTQYGLKVFAAEVVSVDGMVLMGKPNKEVWRQVYKGDKLVEGDLIKTDSSGEARIRYQDASQVLIDFNSLYAVHNSGVIRKEIEPTPQQSGNPSDPSSNESQAGASQPSIFLERIVPFGRSLELTGKVEAGTSLDINTEMADVAGDGSFKHFTKPFPNTERNVQVVLKATDLAGRISTLTVNHEFGSESRRK
jgi:hypothetical protein